MRQSTKNSLLKIPAYGVLRFMAFLLGVVALALLALAGAAFLSTSPPGGQPDLVWIIGGVMLLLMGVAGPVRVIRKGALIPAEAKQMILVQAVVIPLAGLAFLISGVVNSPTAGAWAYGVVGLLT
ncbi:MAG: hypothetical protein IID14_10285, partial [Candidatus Marinimicrobia bacterium]|nr:hypothetical protein [Candidatus Neomarinimicrobiota bacterium]